MRTITGKAKALRNKLTEDIDKDPDSYQEVMAAFQLPKNTQEEKNKRNAAIEQGLKNAALVPLGVARHALDVMDLATDTIKKGNRNAVTDGAVGALAARTAGLAALLNVRINLRSIKDEKFVQELTQEVKDLEKRLLEAEKAIIAQVEF
jgi:formiminotetrahydrofolate cyclodeaminase